MTVCLEGRCSIQLSYETVEKKSDSLWELSDFCCRGDRIRTCDPLVPNQMRYQAALRSEFRPRAIADPTRIQRLGSLGNSLSGFTRNYRMDDTVAGLQSQLSGQAGIDLEHV